VVTSFNYGRLLGSYAAGRAVDAFGDRRVLIACGLASGLLTALAAPLPVAALAVVLCASGLVAATSTPAGSTLVMQAFPPARRAVAMGLRQTGIPLGGLVAAGLLPFLANRIGWRDALAIAGGLTVAGTVVAALASRGWGRRGGPRVEAGHAPRDRRVVYVIVWGCALVAAQYAVVAFLILDVESGGLSIGQAAALLACAQAAGIAGRVLWGAASDRLLGGARRPVMLAISAAAFADALLLALLPGRAGFWALLPVAALTGVSMLGWNGIWVMVVAELAVASRRGAELGFGLTFLALSIVVWPPLFGLVRDATGSYTASWLALAGMLALGALPAALVRR
jgi:MFS family permease